MWAGHRGRRRGIPAPFLLGLVGCLLLVGRPVQAQHAGAGEAIAPLYSDHWAYAALERLAAAGWIEPGRIDGARPLPVGVVADALEEAAARASDGGRRDRDPISGDGDGDGGEPAGLARFARMAWERFRREFPTNAPVAGSIRIGYEERSSRDREWRGRVFEPTLVWSPAPWLGLSYAPEFHYGGFAGSEATGNGRLGHLNAATRWNRVWLFAGRGSLSFGTGASGGVTLSDAAIFDGVGIGLVEPLDVSVLGRVNGLVYVSRIGADEFGDASIFGAMRVSLTPAPWIQLHLNRTLLVARKNRGEVLGPEDVLFLLVGKHTLFEDQRASIGVRLRTNIAGWAVQPYLEWGFEDTAGIDEDPGVVVGLFAPAIPLLPEVSLRYEYTAFGEDAQLFGDFERRNWYRHSTGIRAQYVDIAGTPIGHPLGGYGYEHRVETGVWLDDARVRLDLAAFQRDRKPRNLLYDRRPGKSVGGTVDFVFMPVSGAEVVTTLRAEHGAAGWSTRQLGVALRASL